uniref:Uncharacterized protein n=1 Tax=Arundo donax TaxID=35708 RepID=A0A0A9AD09_ARUDO
MMTKKLASQIIQSINHLPGILAFDHGFLPVLLLSFFLFLILSSRVS